MHALLTTEPNALKLLFNDDIYCIDEAVSAPESEPSKNVSFDYLGGNDAFFLLILDSAKNEIIDRADKEALLKIMQAKKLELKDIAVMNINKYPEATFDDLKSFFGCSRMVLFGFPPHQIGLPPISANNPEKHENVKLLTTYSINEMMADESKKREFWNVMKAF